MDREETDTTILSDLECPSTITMPRGIKERRVRTDGHCLKVIDTALIRSGDAGLRSDGAGEDGSLSELADSIASLGMIEPIVVRRVDAGAFVVVAGERRLAAARRLKLRQVPCVVRECSDGDALLISLTENLQRSDLDPIQKACALRRLLDDFALTQEHIGKRVGMSQSAIAHHLRLLALPDRVQRLISEGSLTLGHGKVLAGMDAEEAVEAASDCLSKDMSVREFEVWSRARSKSDHRLKSNREERELRNGLFLVIKESCDQTCSGTIEIPYYTQDEKEWVLDALSEQGTKRADGKRVRAAEQRVPTSTPTYRTPGTLVHGAKFEGRPR
jgi:ParB family chromosome partitioning protein